MFTADATHRDQAQGGQWVDTEGYVVASDLHDVDDARAALAGTPLDLVLLEQAVAERR